MAPDCDNQSTEKHDADHSDRVRLADAYVAAVSDGVIGLDVAGRIVSVNPMARRFLRISDAKEFPHIESTCRFTDEITGEPWQATAQESDAIVHRNLLLERPDGMRLTVELTRVSLAQDGWVLVLRDLRETRTLLELMRFQASHDSLTELINRREFETLLETAVIRCRETGHTHTLLYLDLDNFGRVNEIAGHAVGDEFLRQLTQCLLKRIRHGDILARIGGDEFAILAHQCDPTQCRRVANEVQQAIRDFRLNWNGREFSASASIGIGLIKAETESGAAALREADIACCVAKARLTADSGGHIHQFRPGDEIHVGCGGHISWVDAIRSALAEDRLEVLVQTAQPLHADVLPKRYHELLVRLRHPSGELARADEFMAAAERYGLVADIDRWVLGRLVTLLETGCMEEWRHDVFAINLSGRSLSDAHFMQQVQEILADHPRCATEICFEVTETAVIGSLEQTLKFINHVRDLGGRFALDDFGSGMSSFRYLKFLPVDFLKIDASFVRHANEHQRDRALLASMLEVGQALDIRTVAEGVESAALVDELRQLGADYGQGYAVATPRPLAELVHGDAGPATRTGSAQDSPARVTP